MALRDEGRTRGGPEGAGTKESAGRIRRVGESMIINLEVGRGACCIPRVDATSDVVLAPDAMHALVRLLE
jgi:hypothetical protein